MIEIVVGLFTHHYAAEAFGLKFRILGKKRRRHEIAMAYEHFFLNVT